MQNNNILTIAIPVYNDNDLLINQLSRIKKQLQGNIKISIYDNMSIPSVRSIVKEKYPDYQNWLDIKENVLNIGADANILRCFVECETKWLWVLSVNDFIDDNAIINIFKQIYLYEEAVLINFIDSDKSIKTIGFKDFCENAPSYGRAFFISACIYNNAELRKELIYYYSYLSSNNGQLLLVLKYLENYGGMCVFSNIKILSYETPATWSKNSFISRSLLIFDAFDQGTRKIFKKSLGIKLQNLLLIYNVLSRINKEINVFQQMKNIILIVFSGGYYILMNKVTYKILLINIIVLFFPSVYDNYSRKKGGKNI
jgi:hypothetical protein